MGASSPKFILGFLSSWKHRNLLKQLIRREVEARYRGTALGFLWAFVSPLILLAVYTFIFSAVFQTRWGAGDESRGMFALTAFCGMISFGVFAEVVGRAPGLIIANTNLVKRVVFPLEVLVPVTLGSALVQLFFGLLVWFTGWILVTQSLPPATLFLYPLVLLPALFYALGLGWFISALGVFFRDLTPMVTLLIQVLFFLTPIFFPLDRVPQKFQFWIQLNPLCGVVEDIRGVLVFGRSPGWEALLLSLGLSLLVALAGSWCFARTKKAFADVI